jgi:hypothetical protein
VCLRTLLSVGASRCSHVFCQQEPSIGLYKLWSYLNHQSVPRSKRFHLGYKIQPVCAVSGIIRCLFSDKNKPHKYSVGRAYCCCMLNWRCITWPIGFKRLNWSTQDECEPKPIRSVASRLVAWRMESYILRHVRKKTSLTVRRTLNMKTIPYAMSHCWHWNYAVW